jgi:AMP nucleosidase
MVVASGCLRDDQVLDNQVPLAVSTPLSPSIVRAISEGLRAIYLQDPPDDISDEDLYGFYREQDTRLKENIRIGSVFTTSDRNWEMKPLSGMVEKFDVSRVIGIDMETGTIAANGFRNRVNSGALLCVSDMPIHGLMKMRMFADKFYHEQTKKHLTAALAAVAFCQIDFDTVISLEYGRDLASLNNPPFR